MATRLESARDVHVLGTLRVTVDREDAWLFEGARMIVRQVAGGSVEETVEALVGEGTTMLLSEIEGARLPDFDDGCDNARNDVQRVWEAQLSAWREEAETMCEGRIRVRAFELGATECGASAVRVAEMTDVDELDAELRRIAAELVNRDVVVGRLAETFWRADGWRRLGFATESQYVRERLGMSLSAVKAKRALGRRLTLMPWLADAVTGGQLGYEAARIVAAVATSETVEAWVIRARERTVKHLREELDAVQMLGRLTASTAPVPPTESIMEHVADIERRVVNGQMSALDELGKVADLHGRDDAGDRDAMDGVNRSDGIGGAGDRDAMDGVNRSDGIGDAGDRDAMDGVNRSDGIGGASDRDGVDRRDSRRDGARRRGGRVTLTFRVDAGLCRYYRWLERAFLRSRPTVGSFFGFLCSAVIGTWARVRDEHVAYGHIYARDHFRCRSPVCSRRDVTPHHLTFRSRSGDDSAANVASLCVWCHLDGIHGGRLTARPPADDIQWTIGRAVHTVVRGRRRQRQAAHRSA